MRCKDQLHRVLEFSETPKRIVSLVPSQTELLVDLGLQSQLVGVTKFCVHPKSLVSKSNIIGGTKSIHLDKIEALQPDIIICNKEENTKEIVASCATIAPVWVSDIYTVKDSLAMISLLATLFEKKAQGRKIIDTIENELTAFRSFMASKPSRKAAYLIWKNPYMAAGRQTFIHDLLLENKFQNIFQDPTSRYPEVTEETLKQADTILLSSEPFPFKEKHIRELHEITNKKVILVDGEYFSWYGSRLQHAFSYFKSLH